MKNKIQLPLYSIKGALNRVEGGGKMIGGILGGKGDVRRFEVRGSRYEVRGSRLEPKRL